MSPRPLAEYLRARRAATSPTAVGLPGRGSRRVPGLRREEVAMLAEVSVDYYTRLGQGRERHPSPQVIDALASALGLDRDGRDHLFRVAGAGWSTSVPSGSERVDPELRRLMDAWPSNPAIVVGCAYDVLAGNHLGEELFSRFPVTVTCSNTCSSIRPHARSTPSGPLRRPTRSQVSAPRSAGTGAPAGS